MAYINLNGVALATESGGVVTIDSAVAGAGADGIVSSASGTAITIDSSNNVTLAGTANALGTVTAGTLGSAVTFPAGHAIQMHSRVIGSGQITGGSGSYTGVSLTDLTINRTSGTMLMYFIQGGASHSITSGRSIFIIGRRTSGSSFTGTEVDLTSDATNGNSRSYNGSGSVLHPHSTVALDFADISGNYTYRWFYKGSSGTVDFQASDRGNIVVYLMEYNPHAGAPTAAVDP